MEFEEIIEQNSIESLEDLISFMKQLTDEYIRSRAREATAEECGLDRRCGNLYVHAEFIACHISDDRMLKYYGGFEYINERHVTHMGDYVIYSTDDSRAMEAFTHYNENT